MPLGLFPRESAEMLEPGVGDVGTSAPPAPGTFAGFGKAGALGVGEGIAKVAAVAPESGADLGAALSPNLFPEPTQTEELSPEEHQRRADAAVTQAVQYFTPDPHTTGAAGEILHGVASGLTRFVAGAAAGGPVAGASVVGLTEGETQAAQLRTAGVDPDTAKLAGLGTALMSGAGSLLPGGVGRGVVSRIATGASIQASAGMINRGMMSSILAKAGYDQMAESYKPLDGQAVLTDMVLGAAFGGVHHAFMPSTVDAAHTAADAVHVEDAAPGVPVTPESRQAHVDNMIAAAEALLSGKDMPELQPVETIANPAQEAARSTNESAVTDVAAEVAGEPVAAPAFAGEERRADAIDSARLAELSQKRNDSGLTADERDEWAALLDQRRLTTRVAGRTIRGVGSYEAYQEMVARGEQKPVVGFADSDMLHSTNETHGYPVGDELIRATGETLSHYFGAGNVFRRESGGGGSDEFIVHTDTPEKYDANMAAAQQHLANHTLRAYDASGNLIGEKKGAAFSHGRGTDEASAVAAAKADKQARAKLGLRTDRGAVAEKPAGARGESESPAPARPETGAVKSPIQATSALSRALRTLADSEGTDEASHAQVRSILQDVTAKGMDAASIERAAVERAGEGADEALGQAKENENVPTPGIGDAQSAHDAYRQAISDNYFEGLKKEIGWDQIGGRVLRESERADGLKSEVAGRTQWVGKFAPDGTESQFWRSRPDAITEKQALEAMRKAQDGEKLGVREQRFVDYARKVADMYAQEHIDVLEQMDADTRESVDAAQSALAYHPDMLVEDENGMQMPASEAMRRAMDDLKQAAGDDELHKVAAACFGRMG